MGSAAVPTTLMGPVTLRRLLSQVVPLSGEDLSILYAVLFSREQTLWPTLVSETVIRSHQCAR